MQPSAQSEAGAVEHVSMNTVTSRQLSVGPPNRKDALQQEAATPCSCCFPGLPHIRRQMTAALSQQPQVEQQAGSDDHLMPQDSSLKVCAGHAV